MSTLRLILGAGCTLEADATALPTILGLCRSLGIPSHHNPANATLYIAVPATGRRLTVEADREAPEQYRTLATETAAALRELLAAAGALVVDPSDAPDLLLRISPGALPNGGVVAGYGWQDWQNHRDLCAALAEELSIALGVPDLGARMSLADGRQGGVPVVEVAIGRPAPGAADPLLDPAFSATAAAALYRALCRFWTDPSLANVGAALPTSLTAPGAAETAPRETFESPEAPEPLAAPQPQEALAPPEASEPLAAPQPQETLEPLAAPKPPGAPEPLAAPQPQEALDPPEAPEPLAAPQPQAAIDSPEASEPMAAQQPPEAPDPQEASELPATSEPPRAPSPPEASDPLEAPKPRKAAKLRKAPKVREIPDLRDLPKLRRPRRASLLPNTCCCEDVEPDLERIILDPVTITSYRRDPPRPRQRPARVAAKAPTPAPPPPPIEPTPAPTPALPTHSALVHTFFAPAPSQYPKPNTNPLITQYSAALVHIRNQAQKSHPR